ncbi:MAG: recombination-associated protein RdgC [Desulfovibrionales bacterium]|nr:recombination-associated protein RdgC [Desulfovibrionales bacterium]
MGIMSASVGLTRYRIVEQDIPTNLWSEIDDRLKRNAFRDIDASAEERSFGWVSFDNMLDPDFALCPPEKGAYLAFTLRLDTRRVPPAVLKKHVQIAMNAAMQAMREQGKRFLAKEQKEEIRDQVALRLRARSLPIPACFDVVWETTQGVVSIASTQSKLLELFEELFTHTFGLHLEPMTPYFLALRHLGQEQRAELESFTPTIFVEGAL